MIADKTIRRSAGRRIIPDAQSFLFDSFKRASSPYINQFISADSIVPDPADPQSWNRYSYVNNNPLRYTDPTGHKAACGVYGEECTEDELDAFTGGGGSSGGGGGGSDAEELETSEDGVDFILYWENAGGPYDAYPYEDVGGTCTIGYGHVLYNPGNGCRGWPNKKYMDPKLYPNGLSLDEALAFLTMDINNAEDVIRKSITADLTQGQFDALVSYIFNSGDQTNQPFFEKNIPTLINNGNYQEAANRMASGPITSGEPPIRLDILVDRRLAEVNLFLNGIYAP